jgi:hypothetical protein
MPCVICRRQARGLLWQSPKARPETRRETFAFCSFRCQTLFGAFRKLQEQRQRRLQKTEVPVIDASDTEKAAMAAALRPLGDYVTDLGLERPLAAYSREEILTLIEIVVDAFQAHLLEVAERQAEQDAERLRRLDRRRNQPTTGEPF